MSKEVVFIIDNFKNVMLYDVVCHIYIYFFFLGLSGSIGIFD